MQILKLDLNLLKVFEATYRLRNLNEVGQYMNLSQPAVSHALRRLRTSVQDRLFIRTATGLEPTVRSEEMIQPIREAMLLIEDTLSKSVEFSPPACQRQFVLLLSDVGELVFLPRLLERLRREAPLAQVTVMQASRTRYDELLRDRDADLAVGHLPRLNANLKQRPLFNERYVILRRRPPNGADTSTISLKEYCEASHLVVDPPGAIPVLQDALDKIGAKRTVVARVPHYLAAGSVVASTDLLVSVPELIAQALGERGQFQIAPLPFEAPRLEVKMYWHMRQDNDPAHRWFRQLFASLFAL